MKKNNRKTAPVKPKKSARQAATQKVKAGSVLAPFLIMLISLAVESCLVFNEKTGFLGKLIYNACTGLFGFAAYLIPVGTLFIAYFFNAFNERGALAFKSVMLATFAAFSASLGSVLSVSGFGTSPISVSKYFTLGKSGEGGGVVGGLVGKLMLAAFGNVLSIIVSVLVCLLAVSLFIGTSKAGLFSRLKQIPVFGAAKTPPQGRSGKKTEESDARRAPAEYAAEKSEETAEISNTESVPSVISKPQQSDPFKYGSEVSRHGLRRPAYTVDLRAPVVKKTEDIYSEEPTAPIDIRVKAPSVSSDTQGGRAYSPFADPLRARNREFMSSGGNGSPYASADARAYSPFADPLRSRDEAMRKNNGETAAEYNKNETYAPEARGVGSETLQKPNYIDVGGARVPQTPSFALGSIGPQGATAAGVSYEAPKSPSYTDGSRARVPQGVAAASAGTDYGAAMRAAARVPSITVESTVPERTAPDTAEEDTAPWDEPVKPVISREVPLNTSKLSDEDYSEDVDDEDGVSEDGEETESLGSTREYKGAYAEKYNIEKQNAERSLEEEASETRYRDRSEKYYPDYVFPSSVLLEQRALETTVTEEDVLEVRDKLLGKLASFKIEASLVGYSAGPTITRYEIAPGPGVKVKAITNLIEDIGLELQSDGVRIATVPGKSVIGIEVPNKVVSVVSLRSLIENRDFMNARSKITVCVGLTVTGKPVYMDIDEMPHVLIAGQTKSGKSVAINCMLLSLLYRTTPDEVQLILIDPKRVELNIYSRVPHLVMPVIDDPQRAAAALRWAVNEMERRYEMMDNLGVRNRDEYYELKEQDPSLEYMPQIVIVIDELADLMLQVREHVETLINRLAAKARACGIHLLVGTQRPSVDIVTGLIKANIPARISFQVSSSADSRIILGTVGAEKLLGKGDMLYQATGAGRVRVQGAFVSSGEIKRVTSFIIEKNGAAEFDPEVMRQLDIETDKINKTNKKASAQSYSGDDDDGIVDSSDVDVEYICKAMEYVFESRIVTTNAIQRHLRIGFNRAADIVDSLEDLGFISPKNGSKPREILIDYESFEQWKLRNAM